MKNNVETLICRVTAEVEVAGGLQAEVSAVPFPPKLLICKQWWKQDFSVNLLILILVNKSSKFSYVNFEKVWNLQRNWHSGHVKYINC